MLVVARVCNQAEGGRKGQWDWRSWEKIVYELNKMRILFLFLENVNMQARVNAKF